MPDTDPISELTPYMPTWVWVSFYYKYHGTTYYLLSIYASGISIPKGQKKFLKFFLQSNLNFIFTSRQVLNNAAVSVGSPVGHQRLSF